MLMFSLQLQQKSVAIHLPIAEAMLAVMAQAELQCMIGMRVKFTLIDLPTLSDRGRLMFHLQPASNNKSSLMFTIQVACIFDVVDLSSNDGPVYCDVTIRQSVEIQRLVASDSQLLAIKPLDDRYAKAFRQSGTDGISASWLVVCMYAGSAVGKLSTQNLITFDQKFGKMRFDVAQWTDHNNIFPDKEAGMLKIKTLINDEVLQNVLIYNLVPDRNTAGTWLLFSLDDKEVGHPTGNYNFVVQNKIVRVGKVGHYWLSRQGKDVEFAGSVSLKSGVVQKWANDSGHFLPHPGLIYQAPFPLQLFEATHVGKLIKERIKIEAQQELARKNAVIDKAIDAEFKNRGDTNSAHAAVDRIAILIGQSKTTVKKRMDDLGVVAGLKTLAWDDTYEPTY